MVARQADKVWFECEKDFLESVEVEYRGLLSNPHTARYALGLVQYKLRTLHAQATSRVFSTDSYRALGPAAGVLTDQAEAIWEDLAEDVDAQGALRHILCRMIVPGFGEPNAARRLAIGELFLDGHLPEGASRVLEMLCGRQVLRPHMYRHLLKPAMYELAYEPLITEWPRLLQWVVAGWNGMRIHHRLSRAAQAWLQGGRNSLHLLRDFEIDETWDWLDRESEHAALNDGEQEFLIASQQERDQGLRTAEQEIRAAVLQETAPELESAKEQFSQTARLLDEVRQELERERAWSTHAQEEKDQTAGELQAKTMDLDRLQASFDALQAEAEGRDRSYQSLQRQIALLQEAEQSLQGRLVKRSMQVKLALLGGLATFVVGAVLGIVFL